MNWSKQIAAALLSRSLVLTTGPEGFAFQSAPITTQPQARDAQQSPEQLQQFVAPIALHLDALVAQIRAAKRSKDYDPVRSGFNLGHCGMTLVKSE
jgi:hypothetical protein